MQPNRYKIHITEPCTENWDKMKSHPTGKFCDSCQKNVVDFTNKTEQEITEYIKAHEGEQMCGRFYNNQIETIRIEFDRNILFTEIPFWQKFLVILLVCFGPDLCGQHFAFAQADKLTDSIPLVQQPIDTSFTTQVDSLNIDSCSVLQIDFKTVIPTEPLILEPWITTVGITLGGFGIVPECAPEITVDIFTEPELEIEKELVKAEPEQPKDTNTDAKEHISYSTSNRKRKAPKEPKEEPFIAVLPESTSDTHSRKKRV